MKKVITQIILLFTCCLNILAAEKEVAVNPTSKKPARIMAGANNTCAGATQVFFNTPLLDSTVGATQSLAPLECNFGFPSSSAKDVWFSFVYTSQMDSLVVIPKPNPDNDIVLELYGGSCASLNFLECSDQAEPNSDNQTEGFYLASLGLTVGTTYRFRVYGFNGVECPFTVLLKSGAALPPPANDDCASAQTLFAGSTIPGKNLGATQSIAPITCQGQTSTEAKDVWYRFTKTALMDSLVLSPTNNLDFILEIRSNNCSSGSSLLCSDRNGNGLIEKIALATLTNGTIYLARVYGKNGVQGEFSLRIKSAPLNNNCSGAFELLPSATCANALLGSTIDASQSLPGITCNGVAAIANDDVWYYFTRTNGVDSLIVSPISTFNPIVEVRSGTCASSSLIRCSNNPTNPVAIEKIYIGNLALNTTYLVRVYSVGGSAGNMGTFRICLKETPAQGPENDECSAPITLTSGVQETGNNENATQTALPVACGGPGSGSANDVWYRFTKTAAIDTIAVDGLGSFDALFDVRSNSCPNGDVVACRDAAGSGLKKMNVGFLTNGVSYLLRVYGRNGAQGTFSIDLLDDNVVVNPPANDECFDAQPLTVGSTCSLTSATTSGATESFSPTSTCPGGVTGSANDVWFVFTATNARSIVRVNNGLGFDAVVQVYSGNCFNPVSLACSNVTGLTLDPDDPTREELFLSGLSIGQQYFIRVFGNNNTPGDFSICVFHPNCNSTAATLSVSSSNILSNEAFTTEVGSLSGNLAYEFSTNQTAWIPQFGFYSGNDTLIRRQSTSGNLFLRAATRTGECYPAYSNVVLLTIRCATPFRFSTGQNFISRVRLAGIDQTSTRNPLGGNVQDFSAVAGTVCRGNTYSLQLDVNQPALNYNRFVWIDYNQDGDFNDAGETVFGGPYQSGNTTIPITIPATAAFGNSRLRIALINNLANISDGNPCAGGPYQFGEIEEYTLTVTSGVLANAGSPQNTCSSTVTLNGNNPGPGNSGQWTVVSGSGNFANPNLFNTTVSGLSPGANVFQWALTNACGTSTSTVIITSTVIQANAGQDLTVCTGTANLSGNSPGSGGSGSWISLGSATVAQANQANTSVNNLAVGSNLFVWSISNPGCPSTTDTVNVIRKNPPTAQAGSNQSLCSATGNLGATAPASGSGQWTLISGSGIISNSTSPSTAVQNLGFGANVFRWTVTDAPCPASSAEVTLTNNLPNKPNAGPDLVFCSAVSQTVTATNLPVGLNGSWSFVSGSGNIANPTSPSTGISNPSAGVNVLVFNIPVPACSTAVSDTLLVTRELNPIDLGPDTLICLQQATTYTLSGPLGMAAYNWNNSPGSQTNTVTTTGTYWLLVNTALGCSFTDTVKVTFDPCVSINGLGNRLNKVWLLPNPSQAGHSTTLYAAGELFQIETQVNLIDARGRQVWQAEGQLLTSNPLILPRHLPKGMYYLRLSNSKGNQSLKWMVE